MFRIPDYNLIQKCGEGAFGEVWLARGLSGKEVAVKIIPDAKLAEKEFEGLKKSEKLPPSDYRVQIFHVGRTEKCLYYVMERADDMGETEYQPVTLAAKLKAGRMAAPEVIALGLKLLQGIEEFHSANLCHRDIKPENIIYVGGKPKLSDMGLVCSGKDARRIAGTKGFIPPEKSSRPDSISLASDDLYALGMLLYCCWTGNGPEDYPAPAEYSGRKEEKILNAVILKAAAGNPEQRFHSVKQFRKQLSAAASGTFLQKVHSVMNSIARQIGTGKSICTVRPELSAFFVGRQEELTALQNLCDSGYFPVIQGAGGTGKTELAAAYAYRHGEEYPEGRFMIRMEHKKSWSEALCSLSEDHETAAYLHLPREFEKKNRKEQHDCIVSALFRKAEYGKLLLVLDNVEDPSLFSERQLQEFSRKPLPGNLHMIATTRQHLKFGLNSRAKDFPIGRLDDQASFELFCSIGHNQYPFCHTSPANEKSEYQALLEMIHLLDGHVWSLEILAVYMAVHYPEGMTFRKKLTQLQSQFCIHGKSSYRHNADDGVVLLKPTLEMIRTQELGDAVLELAEAAAFFPPDEIPVDALSAYWRQHFSNLIYEDGEPFSYALNTLKKFHLLKGNERILKMHRLMQSVLTGKVTADKHALLKKLAEALEKYPAFTYNDWVRLFGTTPEIFEYLSKNYRDLMFPSWSWCSLFSIRELRKFCPWEELEPGRQCSILRNYPQYIDNADLSKFSSSDWSWLLSAHPQFMEKCHIIDQFTAEDWVKLLSDQPQFENQCHVFDQFSDQDWADLLTAQPQFFKYLPPDCCDAAPWFALLRKVPSMADRCPWKKIKADTDQWSLLLLNSPALATHPGFLESCPWKLFNGQDWGRIPHEHPELFANCDFGEFASSDWNEFLKAHPEYEDRCPWEKISFLSMDWLELVQQQPRFVKRIPPECMTPEIWFFLLEENYEYVTPCPWEKLGTSGYYWGHLLDRRPEYEEKCPFGKFTTGKQWRDFLICSPGMTRHFSGKFFTGSDWADVLPRNPQLLQLCPWELFTTADWVKLLQNCPQFEPLCTAYDQFTDDDWENLLEEAPQLAVHRKKV